MKKYLNLFFLVTSGCAILTKYQSIDANIKNKKFASSYCEKEVDEFSVKLKKNNVLVSVHIQHAVSWLGPVVVPLIPFFDGRVFVYVQSDFEMKGLDSLAHWYLKIGQNKLKPDEFIKVAEGYQSWVYPERRDRAFSNASLLIFDDSKLRDTDTFELIMIDPSSKEKKAVDFSISKNWFYFPVVGPMMEKLPTYCKKRQTFKKTSDGSLK